MSINKFNFGVAQGPLAYKPALKDVKNNTKAVNMAVKAPDDYETRDEHGCYIQRSQYVRLNGFIPPWAGERLALVESLEKGDVVRVTYSVHTNDYVNKNGDDVKSLRLYIEDISLVQKTSPPGDTPCPSVGDQDKSPAVPSGCDDMPFVDPEEDCPF